MNKNTLAVLIVLAALVTLTAFDGNAENGTDALYSSIQAPADVKHQEVTTPLYSSIQPPADIKFQEAAVQPYSSIQAPEDLKYQNP